ncbi:MAG TPA: response regulator transcription factor [Chloroflexota bacterium]|nr:response regulator transcription factor [Chloroflexota bacterium]
MTRVLVVEDDEAMRRLVALSLKEAKLEVDVAADGKTALRAFERGRPDLIVLDLILPDIDGFEVCQRIRAGSKIPILMLSALGQEDHVVRGLQLGADDYLAKPFSVRVLLARVEALLRRTTVADEREQMITIGDLTIDTRRIEVSVGGRTVNLTPAEFRIIAYLARHSGRVVNSVALLREAQDSHYDEREAQEIVKVHIRHLRYKIEPDPDAPRYIRTVRGFGYMLDYRTRDVNQPLTIH